MEKKTRKTDEEVKADRNRIASHLLHVVNDASDYQNEFLVPLNRAEIYTIWEALRVVNK